MPEVFCGGILILGVYQYVTYSSCVLLACFLTTALWGLEIAHRYLYKCPVSIFWFSINEWELVRFRSSAHIPPQCVLFCIFSVELNSPLHGAFCFVSTSSSSQSPLVLLSWNISQYSPLSRSVVNTAAIWDLLQKLAGINLPPSQKLTVQFCSLFSLSSFWTMIVLFFLPSDYLAAWVLSGLEI